MFERDRLLRGLRGRWWRSGGEPGGSGHVAGLRAADAGHFSAGPRVTGGKRPPGAHPWRREAASQHQGLAGANRATSA
jgi:hypothetical protein